MPEPKKARTVQRSAKQGRLAFLKELPLDALLNIFSLVEAQDLLALSRSNTWLRTFLLNKHREPLWKQVFDTASLPPVPRGSSLPAWTAVLFDKGCSVCEKTAQKIDFQLRARFCNPCAKKVLRDAKDIRYSNVQTVLALSMIHIGNLVTWPHLKKSPRWVTSTADYYDERDLKDAKTLVADFKGSVSEEEYLASRPDIAAIRDQQTAIRAESVRHAIKCKTWQETIKMGKAVEAVHANQARRDAIKIKLAEMGYDVDKLPYELWSDKLVDQSRALTDGIWKRIKPSLVTTISSMEKRRVTESRHRKIEDAYDMILHELLDKERPYLPSPHMADLLELKTVAAFMSAEEDVTVDALKEAEEDVKREAIAWAEDVCSQLEELIPDSVKVEGSVHVLARPSTLFKIEPHDVPVLEWRNAQTKSKMRQMDFGAAFGSADSMPLSKLLNFAVFDQIPDEQNNRELHGRKWVGTDNIQFDMKAYEACNRAIAVAGIEPQDASDAIMEGFGNRFVCSSTKAPDAKKYNDFKELRRFMRGNQATYVYSLCSEEEGVLNKKPEAFSSWLSEYTSQTRYDSMYGSGSSAFHAMRDFLF